MITVRVPATSANCSIGFDTLGLAFDWRSTITFDKSETLKITGCPDEFCTPDNLVYHAFDFACKKSGIATPPVHVDIDSDIPFARGLGSSSQCVIAGLVGANLFAALGLDTDQLLELAVEIEGHPDNVAPALFGGLNVCVMEDGRIHRVQLEARDWKALVVIPGYEVSTPEARKALPETVSLPDAAMQVGRAMLFEYAWVHQDEAQLYTACKDILHEPSRAKLIRDYPAMQELSKTHQLPFWISGSGSTMAFLSQDEARLEELKKEIEEKHPDLEVRLSRVSRLGAEAFYG